MGTRELLLSNNGIFREVAYFDEMRPQDLLVKTFDESEPYIEKAKMLSELSPGETFRHAAVVPQSVLDRAIREGWVNDNDKWRKWANNADNSRLRTWPGKL